MDPTNAEAWLLLLKILRVEGRLSSEADTGWTALNHVVPEMRFQILRELTLAALTDIPDNIARNILKRWMEADPRDLDARVAYLRQLEVEARADDPDREMRLAELSKLLSSHPKCIEVREVLLTALADAGEAEVGRRILEGWLPSNRDSRYWRLQGRWALEYDRRPEYAISALRTALMDLPQDWRSHYRLARALKMVGCVEEARREVEIVRRLQELLDPTFLEPKLKASFTHLNDPRALQGLVEVCTRAGLSRLANAWRDVGNIELGR
ncbi:MAG: hypothetical protein ACP5XB_04420 [Isosphaeraceae bacterium]